MNKRQLAETLRGKRERLDISQGELARQIDTSQSQVSRWEDPADKQVPSAAKVPALAEALGLDLADLSIWVASASQEENRQLRRENASLEKTARDLIAELRLLTNATRELHAEMRSRDTP